MSPLFRLSYTGAGFGSVEYSEVTPALQAKLLGPHGVKKDIEFIP